MKRLRLVVPIAAVFALSACAYGQGGTGVFLADCSTETAKNTQGVDWETARTVHLRIRQDYFTPSYLGLIQGRAYVLRVENGDDSDHSFRAIDFFRSVSVERVSVIGGRSFQRPCIDALTLPARTTTEVRLVAVRDGSYEFQNNSLLMSMALVGSAGGFITIERPRNIPRSPLESLKLIDRRSAKPIIPRPTPGLFDDQKEETPAPGLFDDQVEETPAPGLFDDQVEEAPAEPPAAVLLPEPKRLPEGMFGEPSPDAIDLPPEQPIDAAPSVPVVRETEPQLDDSVNGVQDEQTTVMVVPGPKPQAPPKKTRTEKKAEAKPSEPVFIPDPPQGPPADIHSDDPDPPRKPGSGGAGGGDTFGIIG